MKNECKEIKIFHYLESLSSYDSELYSDPNIHSPTNNQPLQSLSSDDDSDEVQVIPSPNCGIIDSVNISVGPHTESAINETFESQSSEEDSDEVQVMPPPNCGTTGSDIITGVT